LIVLAALQWALLLGSWRQLSSSLGSAMAAVVFTLFTLATTGAVLMYVLDSSWPARVRIRMKQRVQAETGIAATGETAA
jgi:hypothetical protein